MRSSNHNFLCTSCFITACSALHPIHIFSSSTYVLHWQVYWTSSVILCFFVFDFLPGLSYLPDIFSYQLEPSCSGRPTGLVPLNYIFFLSTLFRWANACGCFSSKSVKIFKQSISHFISFLFSPLFLSKILYP